MNTDWNSPQGDFDTAEKQGELLMLLSRQQVTVHTWDDPDFDYMEEQDLALVVQSPFLKSGTASTPPPPRATRSCSRISPPFWTARRAR